jgi:hypothetical protein
MIHSLLLLLWLIFGAKCAVNVLTLPRLIAKSRFQPKTSSFSSDALLDLGLLAALAVVALFTPNRVWYAKMPYVLVVSISLFVISNSILWGGAWAYSRKRNRSRRG